MTRRLPGSSPADSWQIMSDEDLPADAALRRSTTSGVARRSLALLADNAAMGGGIGAAGVGIQDPGGAIETSERFVSDSNETFVLCMVLVLRPYRSGRYLSC